MRFNPEEVWNPIETGLRDNMGKEGPYGKLETPETEQAPVEKKEATVNRENYEMTFSGTLEEIMQQIKETNEETGKIAASFELTRDGKMHVLFINDNPKIDNKAWMKEELESKRNQAVAA